jgi:heat shock protein HslJ
MSRRHTSNPFLLRLSRALVVAFSISLMATALAPGLATAQDGAPARDLEHEWQLLTYRLDGKMVPVPAGIGATLLLFGGEDAWGGAACSSYKTRYQLEGANLFIDATEPDFVECDVASREFDDVFYDLLWKTASFTLTDSILRLRDEIGDLTMVLTRARIDQDATAARWNLARIGSADGSIEPVIVGLSPWLEFLRGGSVVGSLGCGRFLGTYATNDGTVDISDVQYRLIDCPTDSAAAQAEKIVATLDEIATYEVLPAGLRLQDANGITRLALTPVLDLAGRTWTPTVIYDDRGNPIAEGNELSTSAVQFQAQDATGGTICRPFTARGLRSGLALTIGEFKFAKGTEPCRKAKRGEEVNPRAVERFFKNALLAAASHALRGSELELDDVDGNTLMRLEPQAELVGPTWVVTGLGRQRKEPTGKVPMTATFTDAGLVLGETGVVAAGGRPTTYIADYVTPQATRIIIEGIDAGGFCNNPRRQKRDDCKEEKSFLNLLRQADRYIARETALWLYRGTDFIMRLEPEYLVADEE